VLLRTAQRHEPGLDSTRLQISAFEAINDMVRAASPDTLDVVGQLTPVFLQEIVKTVAMQPGSGEQREKQAELQGQLCGVLQVGEATADALWKLVIISSTCCASAVASTVVTSSLTCQLDLHVDAVWFATERVLHLSLTALY